jgi:hypothetical protein
MADSYSKAAARALLMQVIIAALEKHWLIAPCRLSVVDMKKLTAVAARAEIRIAGRRR